MPRGIIIVGAPGVGKTTLGRELARQLGFLHFDTDEYHWRQDTEVPFTILRPREERAAHLMHDISMHPRFVMSGSMWNIRERFTPLFELAVFLEAPVEVCAERVYSREFARWGDRILHRRHKKHRRKCRMGCAMLF